MSARAELSSVSSRLDELVGRVENLVEQLSGPERDAVTADLYEVERSLRSAQRRLRRVIDSGVAGS
jgi:hypothetical protein